jgi:hypothetical protein
MHAIESFDESHDVPDVEHDAPRILVVDGDLDLRNVLTGCLRELGYAASSAATGREAIRLVANALHDTGFRASTRSTPSGAWMTISR